jgi:hypothetical protein
MRTAKGINPLYDYAARNWGYHVSAALEAEKLILDFLKSERKISSSSQAMMVSRRYMDDSGYSQRVPKQMTGLHLAAYFGLREATIALPLLCMSVRAIFILVTSIVRARFGSLLASVF